MIEYTSIGATNQVQKVLTETKIEHWLSEEVFSLQWWLQVVILVLPWFIWWKLVDRKKIVEVLCFGLLTSILFSILDEVGIELTLWGYPHKLFPLLERSFTAGAAALPVTFMLLYQYFSEWKAYLRGCIIAALILSFALEPIYVWLNIYELYQWNYIYSFLIYIIVGLFCKWLISIIIREQRLP